MQPCHQAPPLENEREPDIKLPKHRHDFNEREQAWEEAMHIHVVDAKFSVANLPQ